MLMKLTLGNVRSHTLSWCTNYTTNLIAGRFACVQVFLHIHSV